MIYLLLLLTLIPSISFAQFFRDWPKTHYRGEISPLEIIIFVILILALVIAGLIHHQQTSTNPSQNDDQVDGDKLE